MDWGWIICLAFIYAIGFWHGRAGIYDRGYDQGWRDSRYPGQDEEGV